MERFKQWIVQHKTIILGLSSTFVMLIIIIMLMDWIVMPLYTHHGAEEELPDVTERPYREAEEILLSKGFGIGEIEFTHDATYQESTVVAQNPQPYYYVKKGRRIFLTLSAGNRIVTVPRVIGKSERDAIFLLRQAGLNVDEPSYDFHSYHPYGVVSDQSLQEGSEVQEHTLVHIIVSNGQFPNRFVVPDVVGQSLEMAVKNLRRQGLEPGEISYEIHKNLVPDTVIRQSVNQGEEVYQGYRVNLVVSKQELNTWEE
ncbi:PASTA domain-containing protein [bacterium]